MTVLAFLTLLSLKTGLVGGFCFLVRARVGASTFPLATEADFLRSPFRLEHDTTFTTNDFDCQVMNQGLDWMDAIVHCCYSGVNLEDDRKWTEEDFLNILKRIYFR